MNDTEVDMFVDTGASTDILDEKTFNKMNDAGNLKLHPPTNVYLHMVLIHSSRW